MATLSAQDLEDIRVEVAFYAGVAVVSTQADIEAAAQALEDWWTDGQATTPSASADATIDAAVSGSLATEERAALKAVWLLHRAKRDQATL